MASNTELNAATGSSGHHRASLTPSPRVLMIDARSTRRNETACQLTAMLPEVIISECSDTSDALWRLGATSHDLVVMDAASCGDQAQVASQYWRLTAPDMQQILIYEDSAALSVGGGSSFDLTRCTWDEMPAPLTRWVQYYRTREDRS